MGRLEQIFVAPRRDLGPLSDVHSPWLLGRWVTLPRADWEAILAFGETLDADAGERLSDLGGWSEPEKIKRDPDELKRTVEFLERLERELEQAPPLVPEPTEDQPEAFSNAALAQMTRDVRRVLEEAVRLGEPFEAWVE